MLYSSSILSRITYLRKSSHPPLVWYDVNLGSLGWLVGMGHSQYHGIQVMDPHNHNGTVKTMYFSSSCHNSNKLIGKMREQVRRRIYWTGHLRSFPFFLLNLANFSRPLVPSDPPVTL